MKVVEPFFNGTESWGVFTSADGLDFSGSRAITGCLIVAFCYAKAACTFATFAEQKATMFFPVRAPCRTAFAQQEHRYEFIVGTFRHYSCYAGSGTRPTVAEHAVVRNGRRRLGTWLLMSGPGQYHAPVITVLSANSKPESDRSHSCHQHRRTTPAFVCLRQQMKKPGLKKEPGCIPDGHILVMTVMMAATVVSAAVVTTTMMAAIMVSTIATVVTAIASVISTTITAAAKADADARRVAV